MKESPASEFRFLIEKWDAWREGEKEVAKLMDDHNITFFFKRDGELYGAPEEARIMFAKIKSDELEEEDAVFPGYEIKKLMETGQEIMRMFSKKDVNKLEIVEPEEVVKLLP